MDDERRTTAPAAKEAVAQIIGNEAGDYFDKHADTMAATTMAAAGSAATMMMSKSETKKSKITVRKFDDRRCSQTDDPRYRLFSELTKASLTVENDDNLTKIEEMTRKYPECFFYKYWLPYNIQTQKKEGRDSSSSKRSFMKANVQQQMMIYMTPLACLSAIQKASLDLLLLVFEIFPQAIFVPDESEHGEAEYGGRLPLHYACMYGHDDSKALWLLNKFPDAIWHPTDSGVLPFYYACGNPNFTLKTIQYFHKLYPESVQKPMGDECQYPIHYACSFQSNVDILLYLVEQAPDVCRKKLSTGATVLHNLCSANATALHDICAVIQAIVGAYPDGPKQVTYWGYMPLHCLLSSPKLNEIPVSTIEFVVQCYPDALKHVTKNGKMSIALHIACMQNASVPILALLLQEYPDAINIRTPKALLPIDLARERSATSDVISFLTLFRSEFESIRDLQEGIERKEAISYLAKEAVEQMVNDNRITMISNQQKNSNGEIESIASCNAKSQYTDISQNSEWDGTVALQNSASATIARKDKVRIHNSPLTALSTVGSTVAEALPGAIPVGGPGETYSSSTEQDNEHTSQIDEHSDPGDTSTSAIDSAPSTILIAAEVAPEIVDVENELQELREIVDHLRRQQQEFEEGRQGRETNAAAIEAEPIMAVTVPDIEVNCCAVL